MSLTLQSVAIDSKDGRTFLRKVMRENGQFSDNWTVWAAPETDWQCKFRRTIKGKLGEPDEDVEVLTDATIRQPAPRELGNVKSFGDCQPVMVCSPRSVHFNGSTASMLAKLLIDGARLEVIASAGSTHSSQYGLSFYHVSATLPDMPYGNLTIGYDTVAKDGCCLCSGSVSIR